MQNYTLKIKRAISILVALGFVTVSFSQTDTKIITPANATINPPGFPVYQNTGNPDADKENYRLSRHNWIKENPDLYNQYIAKNNHVEITSEGLNTTSPNADLPGFPQFISTGNVNQDIENYKIAKDKWIIENQDLYNKYLEKLDKNSIHTTEKK